MYRDCYTIEEIIGRIFENGLKVSYMMTEDGETKHGYYLRNKSVPNNKLNDLPQLERLFLNVRKKVGKIRGGHNQADIENLIAESHLYVFECLQKVFKGEMNHKVGRLIQCDGTVERVKELLDNEVAVAQLCKYTITYVDNKLMCWVNSSKNPDYQRKQKKGEKTKYNEIHYVFLDEPVSDIAPNKYDLLEMETPPEPCTGEVTDYIMTMFFDKLTPKQKLWCKCYMEFDVADNGNLYDLDNNLLYTKQECNRYRNKIKKLLERFIDEDGELEVLDDRIIFRKQE